VEYQFGIHQPGQCIAYDCVASNLGFPEGPVALPDGSVLVVEIARGCLTRIGLDGARQIVAQTGGGPNGAAIGPDGAVYVCNNGGFEWTREGGLLRPAGQAADYRGGLIQRVDLRTGVVEALYTAYEGRRLCGPNDLVFDQTGGFYFTDTGKRRDHEIDRGAVYYARADGSAITRVITPIPFPNGIGLAPDERTLYVAESETGRLWAFAIRAPGELDLLPFPSPNGGRYVHGSAEYQRYDSLKVEQDGRICIATLVKGGITSFQPDGSATEFVQLPDRMTTNLCFAGPDRRTVYATLSGTGQLVKLRWPRAGLALNFNEQAYA